MGFPHQSAQSTGRPGTTSRRSVLKAMATAGFLATGGGLLSACQKDGSSGGGAGGAVNVTLTTHDGWPFGVMPPAKDQKENPSTKAYAGVLQEWLDKNPGVKIKNAALNVWDQEILTTAITGGTAPTAFPGDVIGGWNRANVRSAMLQGLTADVTDYLDRYEVHDKLEDFVKPIWEKWGIDGKFYAAPWLYNVGTGLHFRRDLIQQLGLKEPTPDWTWDDVRVLSKGLTEGKRKGFVMQGQALNGSLNTDGMDFHAKVPAPDTPWNWRWDYSAQADLWVPLIERLRAIIFEDKSALVDISMPDGDVQAAFSRGDACMHSNSVVFYTATPGGDSPTPADLADKLDKPVEEVVGWMTQPVGLNGRNIGSQGQVDLVGFSPDLNDDELDKAVSLLLHVQGPGWVAQRKAVYESTKDPRRVYDWQNFMPHYKGLLDQVPSSPEEAWGQKFMDEVRRAAQIPIAPNEAFYFPPEPNPAPTETAREDMTSRWTNERSGVDPRADLAKLDSTRNQQAKSFTSGVADEEFVKAATAYFGAHEAYWKENAPDYYQNTFQPWYESTVLPALKG
jgi:hypothetical protein